MNKDHKSWNDHELQQAYEAGSDLIAMGRWRETIRIARALLRRDPLAWRSAINAGGFLIEAAPELCRRDLLRGAVKRIEDELANAPAEFRQIAHYNLGNGYLALGQKERGKGPATRPSISQAITHLDEALSINAEPNIRINLANALSSQGRTVEAIDEYNEIIKHHPEWHEVHANRAVAFEKAFQLIQPHQGLIEVAVADVHQALELAAGDTVREKQYRSILLRLGKVAVDEAPAQTPSTRISDWIWRNGLNLNLCPFCAVESPEAFDLYALAGFESTVRRTEHTEQVLDMLNAIHRSYGVARWQLLQGAGITGRPPRDHVVIQRASQDAQHDLKTGLLLTAASGFYSILHQVASAMDAYYGLQHNPLGISLARVWWPAGSRKKGVPRKRSDLHPRLQRTPYLMLSALHRLAFSFEHGYGRYAPLRSLRNSIEHHVVVVRREETSTRYYKYVDASSLTEDVIKLGRIAKATLLYFGGSLWMAEYRRLKRHMRQGALVTPGKRWVERT